MKRLAEKGTDIIFVEKEGVLEVLTDWADKYGIAMVNTRGHLTEYGKDLMKVSKESGAHVVIIADYDSTGVKIASESPLDNWIRDHDTPLESVKEEYLSEHYEMPLRLNWNLFRKIYDIQPTNYEQLISIPGFGPAAVRALSLIGEIIFGTKASWLDPVKFNFAHGGKDGVPYQWHVRLMINQ